MSTLIRVRGQTNEVELLIRNRLCVCSVMGEAKLSVGVMEKDFGDWTFHRE